MSASEGDGADARLVEAHILRRARGLERDYPAGLKLTDDPVRPTKASCSSALRLSSRCPRGAHLGSRRSLGRSLTMPISGRRTLSSLSVATGRDAIDGSYKPTDRSTNN